MASSLQGLYTAEKSLQVNQTALNVVNNNIANMNTDGYCKETVELSEDTAAQSSNIQIGNGANIDSISRNNDLYLDAYYRNENSKLSYNQELQTNASSVENMTNELSSGTGTLTSALDDFYSAAQQLSTNPTDSVSRINFAQNAQALTTQFNNEYNQINQLATSLIGDPNSPDTLSTSKLNINCQDLNNKLSQLAQLNQNISFTTNQGNSPNSLLDQRDKLLDDISNLIPVTVTQEPNNLVSLSMNGINLVDGAKQDVNFQTAVNPDQNVSTGTYDPVVVQLVDNNTGKITQPNVNSKLTSGQLGGIIDSVQYDYNDPNRLTLNNVLTNLNTVASRFADSVNNIQTSGQYINQTTNTLSDPTSDPTAPNLFINSNNSDPTNTNDMTAGNITINPDVINNPWLIAAATSTNPTETGDGSNALAIAQLQNTPITNLDNSSPQDYLASMTGNIGVQVNSINNNYDTQNNVVSQISSSKESETGVNLDEELTSLLQYQRAYEASAKVLTTIDNTIQTAIGMVS